MYQIDKNFCPTPDVKADPFSIDALISWLETKPASGVYCYINNAHCLLAQYVAHHGIGDNVSPISVFQGEEWVCMLPQFFDDIAAYWPHTFGKALKRARAWKADNQ